MRKLLLILAVMALASCGQRGGGNPLSGGTSAKSEESSGPRKFPGDLKVPSIYTEEADIYNYVSTHYWDAFFAEGGKTDTLTILGVPNPEMEQAMSNFINILNVGVRKATPDNTKPLEQSQKLVKGLFDKIEAAQKADTSSHVYLRMTEMVEKYLYDPNSPLRNEDLFLPFVKAMAESPCTQEDMRRAYRHEVESCSVNRFGTVAPDFAFRTPENGIMTLHGIKAGQTILFFSNPGCTACKTIIDDLKAINGLDDMLHTKRLAIVNIYIDEEISKWREYLPNYPSDWINGYDFLFRLRDGGEYSIRAIPSLYLLDSEKRVILKDAPTERLVDYIVNGL